MTNEEPCSICGGTEDEHDVLNHEYNLHNQLIPKNRKKSTPRGQQPILVVGAIDTGLRRLLLEKGILTNEDFATLFSAGTGADGDRGAGETQSP